MKKTRSRRRNEPGINALLLQEIPRNKQGKFEPYAYPELRIYSINFKEFIHNPNGWEVRKEIHINAAKAPERAGTEVIALTANILTSSFPT